MKKQKRLGAIGAYLLILFIGAAIIPALALIAALITVSLSDPTGATGAAALAALLLGGALTGLVAPVLRPIGWLSFSLSSSVTLGALYIVLTVTLSDGARVGGAMLSAVTYVVIFMLASVLSARAKGKRRRRRV